MKSIILKDNLIVHTNIKYKTLLGSSKYEYDANTYSIVDKKAKKKQLHDNLKPCDIDCNLHLTDAEVKESTEGFLRAMSARDRESSLQSPSCSLNDQKDDKKRIYKLNKKKVREKTNALFGLKRSQKFMAFYTFSFPVILDSSQTYEVFNKVLTRLRKDFKLKYYLWVAEHQNNSVRNLHFHLVTSEYMPICNVNKYTAVAIENTIRRYSLISEGITFYDKNNNEKVTSKFDVDKYNGVDVKRVDGNRKRLGQYITKYISKNNTEFEKLPWHCSREVSELFTSQCFSFRHAKYSMILDVLRRLTTYVVDNEYSTLEYFTTQQKDGSWFTPPDEWYELINYANDKLSNNEFNFTRIKL